MALTGIQILKMLPKKNCGECGIPTCLAFAMKVAAGQVEIEACPYVSEEAKATIGEASAPPIRTLKLGSAENAFVVGGETCMFRHEKRFVNPTGIAVLVTTDMDDAAVSGRIERFNQLEYERVGVVMKAELIAVKDSKNDEGSFVALVQKVLDGSARAALILISDTPAHLAAAAKLCGARVPLLYGATADNAAVMAQVAKDCSAPLAVKGSNLDNCIDVTNTLLAAGLKDLAIDTGARTLRSAFEDNVVARRSAVKAKFKPLGFPTLTFPCEMSDDPMMEAMIGAQMIPEAPSFFASTAAIMQSSIEFAAYPFRITSFPPMVTLDPSISSRRNFAATTAMNVPS